MLRTENTRRRTVVVGVALCAVVGVLAAILVRAGNPGNMGICGACFLRDLGGALGLFSAKGPKIFRPEILGVMLGAFLLNVARRRFVARSGSFAVSRFALGVVMGIASLVFLGCPFRMLQRLGALDGNAWLALPGFVAGVGCALVLEKRGYSIGRTQPAPTSVGIVPIASVLAIFGLFLAGSLSGPSWSDKGPPAHAPAWLALSAATVVGGILSLTGFCAISAGRQVFGGRKAMLAAAAALMLGYLLIALFGGALSPGMKGQPIAHSDVVWNIAALALLGFAGALAGGCPVRQIVLSGEGNGDAFVTVVGILVGGSLAHTLGAVSTETGATPQGRTAVVLLAVATALYALAMTASCRRQAASS